MPGSLVNQSASSVTLPQFFQAQITYWIDPVTGALLNVTENEKLTLRDSTGAQALLLFHANLVATTDSVDRRVALDNSQLTKMSLVGTLLPLLSGIVGLILLVVGILVGRRPRQDVEAAPSARSPELAAAEPAEDASLVPGLGDEPMKPLSPKPPRLRRPRGRRPRPKRPSLMPPRPEKSPEAEATAEPARPKRPRKPTARPRPRPRRRGQSRGNRGRGTHRRDTGRDRGRAIRCRGGRRGLALPGAAAPPPLAVYRFPRRARRRYPGARALPALSRDPADPAPPFPAPPSPSSAAPPRSYCMVAATMQLWRHGWGIYAVWSPHR